MNERFRLLAAKTSKVTASPGAFMAAVASILVWAALGPVFHWSETHQLVINTFTTIVTFLMSFLIQNSSDRSDRATHLKLDELLHSHQESSNRLIGLERQRDGALDAAQSRLESAGQAEEL
jgi:low affinity Fe/Cu permease